MSPHVGVEAIRLFEGRPFSHQSTGTVSLVVTCIPKHSRYSTNHGLSAQLVLDPSCNEVFQSDFRRTLGSSKYRDRSAQTCRPQFFRCDILDSSFTLQVHRELPRMSDLAISCFESMWAILITPHNNAQEKCCNHYFFVQSRAANIPYPWDMGYAVRTVRL